LNALLGLVDIFEAHEALLVVGILLTG
jgi:hypothetical protein